MVTPNFKDYDQCKIQVNDWLGGGITVVFRRKEKKYIWDSFNFSTKYKQPSTIKDKVKRNGIKIIEMKVVQMNSKDSHIEWNQKWYYFGFWRQRLR